MEKAPLIRILRIASSLFINLATGYFGVSIFAPILVPDTRLFIQNMLFGSLCLFCAYMCEKIRDER